MPIVKYQASSVSSVFNFHLAKWHFYLFIPPWEAFTSSNDDYFAIKRALHTWAHYITMGSFIGTLVVDTHPVAQGSIGKVEGFRWSFLSGINLPSYLISFHLKTGTSAISNYCDQTVRFVWIEWNPAGLWHVYLCCDPLKGSWKCVTFRGNIITASGHIWYYSVSRNKCLLHKNAQRWCICIDLSIHLCSYFVCCISAEVSKGFATKQYILCNSAD